MTDEAAYEEFVTTRAPTLLRYGYVLTGNAHDAADLLQESLVRLRVAWPKVVAKKNPENYLRTIMARQHISVWRRARRERPVAALPDHGYTDPGLDRAEVSPSLWAALSELPRRQRAVLVLRYYEDRSDEQIAEMLGISRGTVRSQAARALDKLRADHRVGAGTTAGSRL